MTTIGALKKITFYFVLLLDLHFWTNLTSGLIYPRIVYRIFIVITENNSFGGYTFNF